MQIKIESNGNVTVSGIEDKEVWEQVQKLGRQTDGIPQMVSALELQERASSEYCIRHFQAQIENHL